MKLKNLAILLLITIFIGLLPTTAFAVVDDPYSLINPATYDTTSNASLFKKSSNKVPMNARTHGQWICFKNVNFSDEPYAVVVSNCVSDDYLSGNTYEFRLDDPKGKLIATVYIDAAEGWSTALEFTGTVEPGVTGTHDIYVSTNQPNDFMGFYFMARIKGQETFVPYSEAGTFKDIVGVEYEDEIRVMNSLGIATATAGSDFEPFLPMSRREYSRWLTKLLVDEVPASVEQIFSDVVPGEDYTNDINYLYQNNVVTGNSNNTFNPYAFIKVRDAVVMTLRALGYEKLCQYEGGYPYGYDKVARRLGLYANESPEDYLRKNSAAALIYRAIKSEYLEVTGVKDGVPVFTSKPEIMSSTRNIYNAEGVVTATSIGGLVGDVDVPKNSIYIGKELYYYDEMSVNNLLGLNCEFFYKLETNGKKTLKCIVPSSEIEQEIISTADGDVITELSESRISYRNGKDKIEKIDIPSNALWLYNHKTLTKNISNVIKANDLRGTIRVIDNGEGVDTVIVENYDNVKISSFDAERYEFYDDLKGKTYKFDSEVTFRLSDGVDVIAPKKVPKDSIAQLYVSEDEKMVTLLFTDKVVKGVSEELNSDGKIRIGDVWYNVAPEFDSTNLILGANAEFHTNYYGDIVYVKNGVDAKESGVLMGFTGSEEETPYVQIMTGSDTIESFPLASKVYLEGVLCKDYNEIYEGKGAFLGFKTMSKHTLVLYQKNEAGEITMIDSPVNGSKNSMDTLTELAPYDTTKTFYYRSGIGSFITSNQTESYPTLSNAKIIILDGFAPDTNSTFVELSTYKTDEYSPYYFYSTSRDSKYVEIAYCPAGIDIDVLGPYVFVDYSIVAGSGETKDLQINLLNGASEISYIIPEENTEWIENAKKLVPGDCVNIYPNVRGEIHKMTASYYVSGSTSGAAGNASVNSGKGISGAAQLNSNSVAGTVKSIEGEYLEVATYSNTNYWLKITGVPVIKVTQDGEVKAGVQNSVLKEGDKIYLYLAGNVQYIVLYE